MTIAEKWVVGALVMFQVKLSLSNRYNIRLVITF